MNEPTVVKQKGLFQKLVEVALEVEQVNKDGHNDFQNYDYASAEAYLKLIRGPLLSRGVLILGKIAGEPSERSYTTSKGGQSTIQTYPFVLSFVDSETGEREDFDWCGQGDDPGDKGFAKASTNAIKTFLRQQFQIPQGDDPEADTKTDERTQSSKPSGPRQISNPDAPASDKQKSFIQKLAGSDDKAFLKFVAAGVQPEDGQSLEQVVSGLSKAEASAVIEQFQPKKEAA